MLHHGVAFAAHHQNFAGIAIEHFVKQRNNTIGGKIDIFNEVAGFVDHLAKIQFNQFEAWKYSAWALFGRAASK